MNFKTAVIILFLAAAAPAADEPLSLAADDGSNGRRPANEAEWEFWLENMILHHGFTDEEVAKATGAGLEEVRAAQKLFGVERQGEPQAAKSDTLKMLPFPGGRHPRIGFLEGAVRPQRETKVSVFAPWGSGRDYLVVDVPEAIWSNLGLTYLAHTHVDTIWTKQGVKLPKLEWDRSEEGKLTLKRKLPNGITYEAEAVAKKDRIEMELRLTNGTGETLTGLRVQNCVMLKGAPEFAELTNDNKRFEAPFAAVQSSKNPRRWVITAWEPCHRPWGNARCPCLHSDPKFPDCAPGKTQKVRGWLSFYEGDDLDAEFARIRKAWK